MTSMLAAKSAASSPSPRTNSLTTSRPPSTSDRRIFREEVPVLPGPVYVGGVSEVNGVEGPPGQPLVHVPRGGHYAGRLQRLAPDLYDFGPGDNRYTGPAGPR